MKQENSNALRWIIGIANPDKFKIGILTLIQMILGGSSVAYALFLRQLIDSAVGQDKSGFVTAAAASVVLILSQLFLRAAYRSLHESVSASLENRMKERLFLQLMRKDYASVVYTHSGEWMNRITSDTSVVSGHIVGLLPNVAGTALRLGGAVIAMISLEPKFVAILVPGGCLIMLVTFFRKILKALHKEVQEASGWVRIFLQENIENLMIVRLFGAESQTAQQASERMTQHKAVRMKRNRFSNFCNSGLSMVFSGAYLCGAIYCAYQLMNNAMSYGTLTAVLQLINQIQSPFASLSGVMPRYYSMLASAERLMEIEEYTDETPADKGIQSFERIDVNDVSFEYRDERQTSALNHMSLSIRKGEFIVFTGESGCGKSTMMKLLMALYPPDNGTITVDGQPLSSQKRSLFAYVPQGNMLMSGTIRQIVAFGDAVRRYSFFQV